MKRSLLLLLVMLLVLVGCRSTGNFANNKSSSIADWFLPGDSEIDKSRRFWDQTSDNPWR